MTFNIYSLKGNPDAEKSGRWVYPYGPKEDGFPGFKLARAGGSNSTYEKALTAELRPYQKLIVAQKDNPDEKTLELVKTCQRKAFAKACVKDWTNVKDADEQDIVFSAAEAEKMLTDIPQLYDDLLSEAQSSALFTAEDLDEESGN
jgi:hypothetical protein